MHLESFRLQVQTHTLGTQLHPHTVHAKRLAIWNPLTVSEKTERPGQLQVICIMDERGGHEPN